MCQQKRLTYVGNLDLDETLQRSFIIALSLSSADPATYFAQPEAVVVLPLLVYLGWPRCYVFLRNVVARN